MTRPLHESAHSKADITQEIPRTETARTGRHTMARCTLSQTKASSHHIGELAQKNSDRGHVASARTRVVHPFRHEQPHLSAVRRAKLARQRQHGDPIEEISAHTRASGWKAASSALPCAPLPQGASLPRARRRL